MKIGFFKKIWYSIFKIEKYGEMSAQGVGKAITYLVRLALIVAVIISLGTLYQINGMAKKGITFLEEQVGEFTYKDGILNLEKDEVIRAPSSMFGEVIIDTKTESNDQVNQYLNSLENDKGIIVLKDQALVKGISSNGIIKYTYKSILSNANIEELNKQQLIEYVNGSETWKIYALIFVLLLGYSALNSFLPILFNAFILSIFGYLATWFAKIKMRFAAIFNLACYSLTLSILLQAIYIIINIFTNFTIKYFQIMYIAVAAIYIIAAIFLIKSEFIKMQVEVAKTVHIKDKEDEKDEEDKEEENKDKEKEQPKEDKKKKEKNKDTNNDEPEGSEA